MDNVITALIAVGSGIITAAITFRLQFERFKAMDERREMDWDKWRESIDEMLEFLKRSATTVEVALLRKDVELLVKRLDEYHARIVELEQK